MYQKIIVVLLIIFLLFFISNDDKMNKYSKNKNFQYLFLIFIIFCMYNNVNVLFLIIIFLIFIYFNTNLKHKLKNNNIISNFYSGSLFQTFIENFDDGTNDSYEVKPYQEGNIFKEKEDFLNDDEKEDKSIKKEFKEFKESKESKESNELLNNPTLNDNKEIIEPFKLSVKEIKDLYDSIKLEINKLD
jgi:hypothetical protein